MARHGRADYAEAHRCAAWGSGAAGSSTTARSPRRSRTRLPARRAKRSIRLLKTYSIFCVDQVEGDHLDHLRAKDDGPLNNEFIDFEPAETGHYCDRGRYSLHGDRAFYHRSGDYIQVPPKNRFPKETEFYAPAFTNSPIGARAGPNGREITPRAN